MCLRWEEKLILCNITFEKKEFRHLFTCNIQIVLYHLAFNFILFLSKTHLWFSQKRMRYIPAALPWLSTFLIQVLICSKTLTAPLSWLEWVLQWGCKIRLRHYLMRGHSGSHPVMGRKIVLFSSSCLITLDELIKNMTTIWFNESLSQFFLPHTHFYFSQQLPTKFLAYSSDMATSLIDTRH